MPSLLQNIDSILSCCVGCRAWFRKVNLVCDECWQVYKDEMLPTKISGINSYPFSVNCLWNWNLQNDQLLRPMVYSLKGGGLAYFHQQRLSYELVVKSLVLGDALEPDTIIVPAAARIADKRDHAGELARALAINLGFPVKNILHRNSCDSQTQKSKSRQQRKQTDNGSLLVVDREDIVGRPIVFVDDVITSGSTAMAARQALGNPKDFQVWCLLERALIWPSREGDGESS